MYFINVVYVCCHSLHSYIILSLVKKRTRRRGEEGEEGRRGEDGERRKERKKKKKEETLLVAEWIRICLSVHKTWVRFLVWKIPHATGPLSPCTTNIEPVPWGLGAAATELLCCNY